VHDVFEDSETRKMIKQLRYTMRVVLLSALLAACTSPEEKAADYIENAVSLFEQGKLKKAELEYRNALQINRNLPDAWYGLAIIHEHKQDWAASYAALSRIRELAPQHIDGRIKLAEILLAANQLDQALNDAIEIMEMAPDDARSHSLMAAVQYRLENFEGAEEEVDKALAIDPANNYAMLVRARVLIEKKRYDEALQVLDKAIETKPDDVTTYMMKIRAYQETNDTSAVEAVYLSLIARFPDNIAFKSALVRLYIGASDIDSAEAVHEQIVKADPANLDAKLRLVGFKFQHRSVDDAIALVKTYIDSDKDEFRYRFLLAWIYENSGQFDQAVSVYQQIIAADELQNNGLEARNKIALLELRAGNRDQAVALVNEVLAQDKANAMSLLLQARFQLADEKLDDAVLSLRTVLRDNPDSIQALALLGQAYDAMGKTSTSNLAIESYTKAFQLSPGTPEIANRLASILIRKREFSLADEVLLESVAHGNRSVETIKLQAQVKVSLGEWDKAEQFARQLQEIEGQEALSQQALGVVYQGKQEQAASVEAFKRAHELAPASAEPIVALVKTYIRNGKLNDARRFLNSVLSVQDDNITAYLLLGQLSVLEKNMPGAISHFKKVIEINPKEDAGYRALIAIYVGDNNLGKAEMVARQGLMAMPDRAILAMNLASIYQIRQEFDKAIEVYESLLEKNPNLLVARNNLASLLTDYGEDQADLDKARNISVELRDSQIPQFRDTYAWASVKSGINVEEAIVILEGIVKDNDQVDVYSYHLGEAYRVKGETDNAIAYLKKATELAKPGSDIAIKAKQSLQQIN